MKKAIFILTIFILVIEEVNSQWIMGGAPFNRFGDAASGPAATQWRSWGFGDFSTFGATPQAKIHLNDFYTLTTPNFGPGLLLRTDGNSANTNSWSMWTGLTDATSVEKFNFLVPSGTNDMEINTVQPGSQILMQANANTMFRMTSTAATVPLGTGQIFIQNDASLPTDDDALILIGGAIKFDQTIQTSTRG